MARHSILRIPRPKTFLYLISLRTATELIFLTLLINKLSGFYGILALFTGYHLDPAQLSMYIYSICVLGLGCYLTPFIRKQAPLQCLALAWLYLVDSLVNAAYTALFATSWFVLLSHHLSDDNSSNGGSTAPGGKMMNDTAGFTDPLTNATRVEVLATPASGPIPGQDAVAFGTSSGGGALGNSVVFQSGSFASIAIIVALWTVRVYFCLVVFAYARGVLRQHILTSSASTFGLQGGSSDAELAENPFREGREEGEGLKGRLGRLMTRVGERYWLGKDDDDEWVRGAGDRFRKSASRETAGVGERERRARAGTGPPPLVLKKPERA